MDLSSYRNVIDFKNVCRTCMSYNNSRQKIQDQIIKIENKTLPTLDVLNLLGDFKLYKNYPDEICTSCTDKLQQFYKLKLQLEKSEAVLKKHLGVSDNEITTITPLRPSGRAPLTYNQVASSHIPSVYLKIELVNPYQKDTSDSKRKNEADIDLGPTESKSDDDSNIDNENIQKKIKTFRKKCTSEQRKNKRVVKKSMKEVQDEESRQESEKEEKEPAFCTQCNKAFKTKYILNVHLKRHKFKGQYLCTLCGKGFSSQSCLTRHTKVHTGEKRYRCDICQKCFPSSNNLNIHLRTHTGDKPYLCELCGKSFGNRTGLNAHEKTHSQDRQYACDVCQKSFVAQSHLDLHKMIHTGERPFPCDQCDKAFIKKCDLQRHISTHTGDKPFVCSFCNKRFSTRVHLQYHTMVHTEERPHKCPVCTKGFIRRYYLREHMMKQHGTVDGMAFRVREKIKKEF